MKVIPSVDDAVAMIGAELGVSRRVEVAQDRIDVPGVSNDNYRVENAKMGIIYEPNKVRFLSAATAGSRVRVRSELAEAMKVCDDIASARKETME